MCRSTHSISISSQALPLQVAAALLWCGARSRLLEAVPLSGVVMSVRLADSEKGGSPQDDSDSDDPAPAAPAAVGEGESVEEAVEDTSDDGYEEDDNVHGSA